jgi:hypothetical protein
MGEELKAREHATEAQRSHADIPNGPAAAAIMAAGIGSCALGVLAVVADASKTVGGWFTFYFPSGPLSGVTSVTILAWLISWWFLAKRWRARNVNLSKTNALAFLLLALSLLLTFPPLADLLSGK